ncbi:MAG: hypothetical protein JST90_04890 [Bacteroidetes bacterium]|nr:hypothetical protein [Bacteroidota bacterium]
MKRHLLLIIAILGLAHDVFCKGIEPGYYHLKGKIDGKYAITMDLTISYWSNRGILASGYYSYDAYQNPIKIYQWYFQWDSRSLKDSLVLHTDTHEIFSGGLSGDFFTGMWSQTRDDDKTILKRYSFELERDTIDAISLRQSLYLDSVSVLDREKHTIYRAYYASSFLYDVDTPSDVQRGLLKFYQGRSEAELEHYMRAKAVNQFHDFKKIVNSGNWSSYGFYDWHEDYTINVLFNDSNILSLEQINTINQDYSHGITLCTFGCYSVLDKRLIRINDIISPKDSSILIGLWIKYMRKIDWLRPQIAEKAEDWYQPLRLPDQFIVTPKGIALIYPSAGVPTGTIWTPVFIPFADLGSHLKKQPWMQL